MTEIQVLRRSEELITVIPFEVLFYDRDTGIETSVDEITVIPFE